MEQDRRPGPHLEQIARGPAHSDLKKPFSPRRVQHGYLELTARSSSASAITTPFGFLSTATEVAQGIDLTGRRAVVTGASSGLWAGNGPTRSPAPVRK